MRIALAAAAMFGAALLSGCGTMGNETAALASQPIANGKARVTFSRVSTVMYAGAPATITLNGEKVGDLASGGVTVIDVPAGDNVITASAWSYPGTSTLKREAKPGQQYNVEISPRGDSFVPSLLGPVGGVVDSAANGNAGAFQLKLIQG